MSDVKPLSKAELDDYRTKVVHAPDSVLAAFLATVDSLNAEVARLSDLVAKAGDIEATAFARGRKSRDEEVAVAWRAVAAAEEKAVKLIDSESAARELLREARNLLKSHDKIVCYGVTGYECDCPSPKLRERISTFLSEKTEEGK
jgi:uncharacterized protein YhaN